MTDNERAFLLGLRELTLKHGITIDGCGCCGSPWLWEDPTARDEQGGYAVDAAAENLVWLSPNDELPSKWRHAKDDGRLVLPEVVA